MRRINKNLIWLSVFLGVSFLHGPEAGSSDTPSEDPASATKEELELLQKVRKKATNEAGDAEHIRMLKEATGMGLNELLMNWSIGQVNFNRSLNPNPKEPLLSKYKSISLLEAKDKPKLFPPGAWDAGSGGTHIDAAKATMSGYYASKQNYLGFLTEALVQGDPNFEATIQEYQKQNKAALRGLVGSTADNSKLTGVGGALTDDEKTKAQEIAKLFLNPQDYKEWRNTASDLDKQGQPNAMKSTIDSIPEIEAFKTPSAPPAEFKVDAFSATIEANQANLEAATSLDQGVTSEAKTATWQGVAKFFENLKTTTESHFTEEQKTNLRSVGEEFTQKLKSIEVELAKAAQPPASAAKRASIAAGKLLRRGSDALSNGAANVARRFSTQSGSTVSTNSPGGARRNSDSTASDAPQSASLASAANGRVSTTINAENAAEALELFAFPANGTNPPLPGQPEGLPEKPKVPKQVNALVEPGTPKRREPAVEKGQFRQLAARIQEAIQRAGQSAQRAVSSIQSGAANLATSSRKNLQTVSTSVLDALRKRRQNTPKEPTPDAAPAKLEDLAALAEPEASSDGLTPSHDSGNSSGSEEGHSPMKVGEALSPRKKTTIVKGIGTTDGMPPGIMPEKPQRPSTPSSPTSLTSPRRNPNPLARRPGKP